MRGEISMEITQKLVLTFIAVDLVTIIALIAMYPLVLLPVSYIVCNAIIKS